MQDFIIFGSNNHIVHIDVEPSLCNFLLEDVIHHCLKGSWGVGQAKEHDCWFKESFTGLEGGFVLVAFFDTNIVVSPVDVELGEQSFLRKVID